MNLRSIHLLSRAAFFVVALPLAASLAGCGKTGKDERASYEICLAAAKSDARIGKATFATFEQSNIQGSTGDSGMRVNIPHELDGKKALYQCIAEKQTDGTFKVIN